MLRAEKMERKGKVIDMAHYAHKRKPNPPRDDDPPAKVIELRGGGWSDSPFRRIGIYLTTLVALGALTSLSVKYHEVLMQNRLMRDQLYCLELKVDTLEMKKETLSALELAAFVGPVTGRNCYELLSEMRR